MIILILIDIWFGCGFIAAGMFFAYAQGNWPTLAKKDRHIDSRDSWWVFVGGICSLIAFLIFREKNYGWKKWW